MVPHCRGISLRISPIASAKFNFQGNRTAFKFIEGCDCYGFDLQQNSRVNSVHRRGSSIKTVAGAFKDKTGTALFKGDVSTKTGATSWISRRRKLLQLSMYYRFLRLQSEVDDPLTRWFLSDWALGFVTRAHSEIICTTCNTWERDYFCVQNSCVYNAQTWNKNVALPK